MKKVLDKITNILSLVFGYGILISIFIGGISFIGYVVALIVGGEMATTICTFIYKTIYPYLVYGTSVITVVGLVVMYIKGQTAFTTKIENKKEQIAKNVPEEKNQEKMEEKKVKKGNE